jgi:tetratricopeptide (TPR) repeat protein
MRMDISPNPDAYLPADMVAGDKHPPDKAVGLEARLETVAGQLHDLMCRLLKAAWLGRRSPLRENLSEQVLADANAMLGNGYLQSGQYDKAVEALNNAIRHDPQFAKAYYLLGMTRSCQGEYAAAIGHYSQAIALRPDKSSYYFCRARAYEALRQPHRALEDYARVLLLDPEHHGARTCYQQLKNICQRPRA